jgi:tRNA (mo5U34)-methyltransferase
MLAQGVAQAVAEQKLWYHTLDLAPGVTTPGWFDLRPIVELMPWPDVRGKRCLDVGTYDGFLAFELERRGAAEVVATDIESHEGWDWLPRVADLGPAQLAIIAGEKGRGFEIAAAALESRVDRRFISIYDLSPASVGTFDVVVCGSLMLHLRDPFRALAAIRSVCAGQFLSAEQIDVQLSILERRRGTFHLRGQDGQWLIPSRRGHREMLQVAGFDIEKVSRPYAVPFGTAHPAPRTGLGPMVTRRLLRGSGVPMSAALTRVSVPSGS